MSDIISPDCFTSVTKNPSYLITNISRIAGSLIPDWHGDETALPMGFGGRGSGAVRTSPRTNSELNLTKRTQSASQKQTKAAEVRRRRGGGGDVAEMDDSSIVL